MSDKAALAGKLPGNPLINGVDPFAGELVERFDAQDVDNPAAILVIGILRVRKYETSADENGNRRHKPTLELSRVEALGVLGKDPMDSLDLASTAAQKMLLSAAESRTGDTPLPIDAESADDAQITVIGDSDDDAGAQVIQILQD